MSKANKLLWQVIFLLLLLNTGGHAQKRTAPAKLPRPRPAPRPSLPSANPPAVPANNTATAATARAAALREATEQVLRETSALRQLSVLRAIPSDTQSRAQIEASLVKDLDTVAGELHTNELLYRKLGLVPADFQLRPFFLKLLTEQVAGYYDIRAGRFYVADWLSIDQQKPVMAHELTHALQDQHFNLRRFLDAPPGANDAQMAVNALIEGDAMLLMRQYVLSNPLRAFNFGRAFKINDNSPTFAGAPRIIRESLTFPYQNGLAWAAQVYGRGGWAAVSQAYTDLPQSTTQILHPDKYFARVAPLAVALPDVSAQLGPGWRRVGFDVRGEFHYFLTLDEWLKDEAAARAAADGWRGDNCAVYEQERTGQTIVLQVSLWDDEAQAEEFLAAYGRRNDAQYSIAGVPAGPDGKRWDTTDGTAWLIRRGTRVWTVDTLPASVAPEKLAASLWDAEAK